MVKNKTSQGISEERKSERNVIDDANQQGVLSEFLGAIVQSAFTKSFGSLDISDVLTRLNLEGHLVMDNNDLRSAEKMLIIQAIDLNAIFNCLAYKASCQKLSNFYETYMRLALKAQTQCRATLETLANIKNPPHVAFVKQANIGHNQQVNNVVPDKPSRARDNKKRQTQLLGEKKNGKRLDSGTQGASIKDDKKLGTVEKIYRTKKR